MDVRTTTAVQNAGSRCVLQDAPPYHRMTTMPHRITHAATAGAALAVPLLLCAGVVLGLFATGPDADRATVLLALDQPADQPADQPTGQPAGEPTDQPAEQSAGQPAGDQPSEEQGPGLHPLDEPDQEHRLSLRSGGELVGVLLERTELKVLVRVDGAELRLQPREVVSIEQLDPLDDRYRRRRSNISDSDARSLVALAGWLRSRGAYRTALREARAALRADPFNAAASDMVRWLEAHIALLEAAERRQRPQQDDTRESGQPDPAELERERRAERRAERLREIRRGGFPTLTPEQINLMRVWEIDTNNPPRLVVPDDVLDRFFKEYADHPLVPQTEEGRRQLRRAPDSRVLDLLFRLRAEEFYDQVRVLDHPGSIRLFRENLHFKLINACASNACHGGQEAGRLWLRSAQLNSDATVYTNLYILDGYRLDDGTPLIDYDNPAESALLHMATLRGNSRRPHPEIGRASGPRYRPLYRSPNEPAFREAVDWIESMYRPRPEYDISYDPPVSASARRAASAPDSRGDRGGGEPQSPGQDPQESPPEGDPAQPQPETQPAGWQHD